MKENIYRTHYCGEISESDVNSKIKISGWVENIRNHGGVVFADIRDEKGIVQIVSNNEKIFDDVTRESVILVEGIVRKRAEADYNAKISTGKIEIAVEKIEILGKARNVLPFEVMQSREVGEEVRLKYRYLDLRNKKVHDNIVFRSQVIKYLRSKMEELGHLEVQTPILTASSPEGARDFIVPARKFKGKFYALPQAPQIFKQLLMCSGFDKYFQIAPCFRDEDARADRVYGEFYQLDLEMAFATEDNVLDVGEEVFYDTFKEFGDKEVSPRPFRRIAYKEAMEKYGTDKPDLRNPLEIIDVSNIFAESEFKPFKATTVKGIVVQNIATKSNAWFNEMAEYAKTIGMPGIGYLKVLDDMSFVGPIDKFMKEEEKKELIEKANLKPQSVIFFIAAKKDAEKLAGLIRIELGERLDLIDESRYEFCIVNDFPMYEFKQEEQKYDFCHNPFSMPKGGLDALKEENIDNIVAYQYDFVCNGIEMASGAVRNHNIEIMKKAFNLVGYEDSVVAERFKSLYSAFQYGAPPHAGMALGIDRMIMLLKDETSIRETIAFPMNASGQDLLMGAPSDVTELQLREAHIKIR